MNKPLCKRGHLRIPENLTKIGACKICRTLWGNANYKANKETINTNRTAWRKKNPVKIRQYQRKAQWKYKGVKNITWEYFLELLAKQNFSCGICQRKIDESAHVDHSHKTGEVRKLLCGRCNQGLGLFQDDSSILTKAVAYLKEFNT